MRVQGKPYRTIWMDGTRVYLINQPLLPHKFEVYTSEHHKQTAEAITTMVVRGAGAIGATGAAGMAQAICEAPDSSQFWSYIEQSAQRLRSTRPTAQNLFYGINAVLHATKQQEGNLKAMREAALTAAQAVADKDAECCNQIGQHGMNLLSDGMGVSTHCNAGWLAFVDWGSALSPIYHAHRAGVRLSVFVDETRPRGQGARLTAWELLQEGVSHTIAADGALGHFMQRGEIQAVIVGADRIAANGDVANKIGTYMSAVAAREHNIPFYVAAPTTTIDIETHTGADIPIEERSQEEVSHTWGWSKDDEFTQVRTIPLDSTCRNPAFDVTPSRLITGILTEQGLIEPGVEGIAQVAPTKNRI